MAKFRVYAIGGVRYVDLEDAAIDDVEQLYLTAQRAGYVFGLVQDEDRVRKVLIPARGIGVIVEAD